MAEFVDVDVDVDVFDAQNLGHHQEDSDTATDDNQEEALVPETRSRDANDDATDASTEDEDPEDDVPLHKYVLCKRKAAPKKDKIRPKKAFWSNLRKRASASSAPQEACKRVKLSQQARIFTEAPLLIAKMKRKYFSKQLTTDLTNIEADSKFGGHIFAKLDELGPALHFGPIAWTAGTHHFRGLKKAQYEEWYCGKAPSRHCMDRVEENSPAAKQAERTLQASRTFLQPSDTKYVYRINYPFNIQQWSEYKQLAFAPVLVNVAGFLADIDQALAPVVAGEMVRDVILSYLIPVMAYVDRLTAHAVPSMQEEEDDISINGDIGINGTKLPVAQQPVRIQKPRGEDTDTVLVSAGGARPKKRRSCRRGASLAESRARWFCALASQKEHDRFILEHPTAIEDFMRTDGWQVYRDNEQRRKNKQPGSSVAPFFGSSVFAHQWRAKYHADAFAFAELRDSVDDDVSFYDMSYHEKTVQQMQDDAAEATWPLFWQRWGEQHIAPRFRLFRRESVAAFITSGEARTAWSARPLLDYTTLCARYRETRQQERLKRQARLESQKADHVTP